MRVGDTYRVEVSMLNDSLLVRFYHVMDGEPGSV
jgi:hypothetical protein